MFGDAIAVKTKDKYLAQFYTVDGQDYEVGVYYSLGGMNYFTGRVDGRGIYLHVMPVQLSKGCITFTAFKGIKKLVVPMKRFSAKKFDEAVDTYLDDPSDNETVVQLYNHITK